MHHASVVGKVRTGGSDAPCITHVTSTATAGRCTVHHSAIVSHFSRYRRFHGASPASSMPSASAAARRATSQGVGE